MRKHYLCSQIGPFCTYIGSSCNKITINSCSEIVSSNFPNLNEEICNTFKIEDSNKICSLKADKSGCEEKDPQQQEENQEREQDNKATQSSENTPENSPTGNPESQGDASGLRMYGISLIITFLCLLN